MTVKHQAPGRGSRWHRALQILAICLFLCCLAADARQHRGGKPQDIPGGKEEKNVPVLKEEQVSVHIPGLKNHYTFIFMSDVHIIVENDEISPDDLETVRARREEFCSSDGRYASELWKDMPELFHSWDADAVLLGGDMIDFASTSNINCLKEGIDRIDVPVLYVRADHDYNPYHCEGLDKKEMKILHQSIDGYEGVSLLEFEDLCLVGLNNSTEQVSSRQLKRIKEIFEIGKPIILLTHVPINSIVDASLSEQSKAVWQDRALVWGKGCYYEPNKNTDEFLELVYAEDSPVKAVMSGHLHFTWEGQLTQNCMQHVFSAMYPGSVGMITVNGEE